jgi:NodT family efflux transporter outer membrane factor (OMF) lipoprotein
MTLKINVTRISVAGTLLLLSACNPAFKYAKPPAPVPVAYKETAPQQFKEVEGWKIATPGDDKIRGKWWEMYNDPVLSGIEEKVQISNQTVKASEANFRAARALVVSARSQLYPLLTASPSYSNSRFSSTSRTGTVVSSGSSTGTTTGTTGTTTGTTGTTTGTTGTTTGTTGTTTGVSGNSSIAGAVNQFSLPFDLTYTVDFWHKIRNAIAENVYTAQADAADVATALLTTQSEVAQDYFEVRSLDTQRQILADTVAAYKQSLTLTTILYNTGIDSEQDVAQAQTQLDTATAQATDLGVSRSQYEHAIAVLIGQPPASFFLPVAPFNPHPPQAPVGLPSALLERRPDIAADERLIAAANAQIGVAKAAYYPDLTLSASGGFQSSSFTQWFTWPSRFWSVGPTLAQTLFDGGARRAATEQAEAQYDMAVANYRQTVLTAFQNVEDNLSALRILEQEVGEEQTAVVSAERYLKLALTRYQTGVDSYLNVITAQNSVLTNRETEVSIQLREMTASVLLVVALGGGWDERLPTPKELIAKPPAWTAAGFEKTPPQTPITTPNPPVIKGVPPQSPLSGVGVTGPQ